MPKEYQGPCLSCRVLDHEKTEKINFFSKFYKILDFLINKNSNKRGISSKEASYYICLF